MITFEALAGTSRRLAAEAALETESHEPVSVTVKPWQ